jgi:hypothetical protein
MATIATLERPISVEKGIPIESKVGRGAAARYPFAQMEVGDSFFVPGKRSGQLSNHCSYQRLKTGRRFTIRKVDGGVRVWRIA